MQEAEQRGQFTFYASIFESASRIRNKAARADFYDAICNYALNGVEPNLEALSDAGAIGFISARPNLYASRKKAKSGSKGGKVKQTESKPKQTVSKSKQTASEKEREKEREKEKENECYNAREAAFDAFWSVYPKKVGKGDAKKAFSKVKVPVDVLITAVERQKCSAQWTKDGGQYIPNPATWLNQGRWEDELPESVGMPKGASGTLGQAELEAIQKLLREEEG